MGMRQASAQPTNQAPASDHSAGDFESAFGGLLGEEEKKPIAQPKTQDGDNDEDNEEETLEELESEEVDEDPIDKLEEASKAAREKWKMQKENKELKAKLEKLEAESKKGSLLDAENPIGEILKHKKWSKDDLVNKALEAMEDDGLTPAEAKKEVKQLTEEEITEKVIAKLKEKEAEKEESEKASKAIETFKTKIKEHVSAASDKYPLIDGLGGLDTVYGLIEQQWIKDKEELGDEFATKNMMTIDQAAKKVNDQLALSVKNALKSNHVRQFIQAALKDESGKDQSKDSQLEDFFQSEEEPSTLTNKVVRKVTDPRDERELTEEERFKSSFAYLDE